jgi:NifU-like protein involved in Fe-S cluster formation
MNAPLYTTEVLRLAASLRGPGEIRRIDGDAELRSKTCGSRIRINVQLDRDRRIEAISQEVHACAFGQAAAALVERHAIGQAHDDIGEALLGLSRWLAGEEEQTRSWPDFSALEPARKHKARHAAILLPFRTLLAAIESAR